MRPEVGRRSRSSERYLYHGLVQVFLERRMMRRLEHKDLAVFTFERRNTQARRRGPKLPITKYIRQDARQRLAVVAIAQEPHLPAQPPPQVTQQAYAACWKNLTSPVAVKVAELAGGKAGAETERENAPGGRADDKIEAGSDGPASQEAMFQRGQHIGREEATDAAAINGKDAKVPIFRPTEWNAPGRGDAC